MSLIIKDNKFKDNIASTSHTVSSSTVTAVTSIDNLFSRSILQGYEFTSGTTSLTHTITINLTTAVSATNIFLPSYINSAGSFIPAIDLYDSSLVLQTTVNIPAIITSRNINDDPYYYLFYSFNEPDIKRVVLRFTNSSSLNSYIGLIYMGDELSLNVAPTSLSFTFGSDGTKIRTDGGQVYANKNNSYLKASFKVTAKKESEVVSDYFNLNYDSSISEPIIFIPNITPVDYENAIILYGTQEKPCSTRIVNGKRDGEWLYETSFSLEEEL